MAMNTAEMPYITKKSSRYLSLGNDFSTRYRPTGIKNATMPSSDIIYLIPPTSITPLDSETVSLIISVFPRRTV